MSTSGLGTHSYRAPSTPCAWPTLGSHKRGRLRGPQGGGGRPAPGWAPADSRGGAGLGRACCGAGLVSPGPPCLRGRRSRRLASAGPAAGVLAPHCLPGAGFLDWVPKKMQRVGCVELLNTVQRRVQPRLHVFGHIHEGGCAGWRRRLSTALKRGRLAPPPRSHPLPDLLAEGNSPFLMHAL